MFSIVLSVFGNDFIIRYNPPGDGNCQFMAASDQLALCGSAQSHVALRRHVVDYIRSWPPGSAGCDGNMLQGFMTTDITTYTNQMSRSGTYGDHITLYTIARIFNIQIVVISSNIAIGATLISTSMNDELRDCPYILLGHIEEGKGEHYVSLEATNKEFTWMVAYLQRKFISAKLPNNVVAPSQPPVNKTDKTTPSSLHDSKIPESKLPRARRSFTLSDWIIHKPPVNQEHLSGNI